MNPEDNEKKEGREEIKKEGKEEVKKEEKCCSDPSTCCPEEGEGLPSCGCEDTGSGKKVKTKTLFFYLIILAAVFVAGQAVMNMNNTDTCGVPGENILCGINIDSFSSLNNLAQDMDFVMVLIPGAGQAVDEGTMKIIEKVVKNISGQGEKVGTFTLSSGTKDYETVIEYNKIKNFPAVLAMGRGCGSALIQDGITEEKLMAGHRDAMKVQKGCCP